MPASGVELALHVAGFSHVGKVRASNEDRLVIEDALGLYAVLDGMGGHAAGDVAAQLAADTLCAFVEEHTPHLTPNALLSTAFDAASAAVYESGRARSDCRGMGTTAVAAFALKPASLLIAHAGDSRAYLLRRGELQRLTRDHTWLEDLIQAGKLSREEEAAGLLRHQRTVITRCLGKFSTVQTDMVDVDLEPGDRVLLCSDGLHGDSSDEAMKQALSAPHFSSLEVAHALIHLALADGGRDNISAIVISVGNPYGRAS